MTRWMKWSLGLGCLLGFLAAGGALAHRAVLDRSAGAWKEGEVLVRLRLASREGEARSWASASGVAIQRSYPVLSQRWGHTVVLVRSSRESTEDLMKRLEGDPRVLSVCPNYVTRVADMPNDPRLGEQWGLENRGQAGGKKGADIRAVEGWKVRTDSGSSGDLVVAILDSGIDEQHEDLRDNLWTFPSGPLEGAHGWDFVDKDPEPRDENGHGTHCAGIVGALGNNGRGIAGVNWRCRLLACRTLDRGGYGDLALDLEAYDWLLARIAEGIPIRVVSASFGRSQGSQLEQDALKALGEVGVLFVAAAGNDHADNDRSPFYPASYRLPNVISVAATDESDNLAWFSNWGALRVHLAAPGQNILSCWPDGESYHPVSSDLFFDDVEGEALRFRSGATKGRDLWERTQEDRWSTSHSWGSSPVSPHYEADSLTWLELSGDLDLSVHRHSFPTLGFHVLRQLEHGSATLEVEMSGDGGSTWKQVWRTTGYERNWEFRNIPVPLEMRTPTFRFRFVLRVNAFAQPFPLYRGVFLDDIGVGEAVPSRLYHPLSGTSQATPFVAGAAALLAAENPRTPSALKERLMQLSEPLPSLAGKIQSGGRLRLDWVLGATQRPLPPVVPLSGEILVRPRGGVAPVLLPLGAWAVSLDPVSQDFSSRGVSSDWRQDSGDRILQVRFRVPVSRDALLGQPRILGTEVRLFVPWKDLLRLSPPLTEEELRSPGTWLRVIQDSPTGPVDLGERGEAWNQRIGGGQTFVSWDLVQEGVEGRLLLGIVDGSTPLSGERVSPQNGWFLLGDALEDGWVEESLGLRVSLDPVSPSPSPPSPTGYHLGGGCGVLGGAGFWMILLPLLCRRWRNRV